VLDAQGDEGLNSWRSGLEIASEQQDIVQAQVQNIRHREGRSPSGELHLAGPGHSRVALLSGLLRITHNPKRNGVRDLTMDTLEQQVELLRTKWLGITEGHAMLQVLSGGIAV
jgi:hypothetical protein